jgi:hypothetical protein
MSLVTRLLASSQASRRGTKLASSSVKFCRKNAHRAQPVGVSATMVEFDGEDHLRLTTCFPDSACVQPRKIGSLHTMMRMRSVQVLAFFRCISSPWSAACKSTRIGDRCIPRSSPRIVPVNVKRTVSEPNTLVPIRSNGIVW